MADAELRSSGIYGLFRLDGAPVAAGDPCALGMDVPETPISWLIEGHDQHAPTAVHRHADGGGITLLVGEITGAEDLAALLGLLRGAPKAQIAQAALKRFGSETPAHLLGEWSLLHRAVDGRLTLMVSPARRDRLHFAVVGAKVAVAPDLFRLARIDWIGAGLDEAGLLFALGNGDLRRGRGERTMLARVRQLEPGSSVVIDLTGRVERRTCEVLTPQPSWRGTFADALAESEALLRTIMRERLADNARLGLLLSGGLDSSLLAWLASEERSNGQALQVISSAAPIESGLPDETGFAAQVTDHLGLTCSRVAADWAADIYRPPLAVLSGASGPPLSNRHCLTEAFQIAAKAGGVSLLVNGTYGEMTATARLPATGLVRRLRRGAAKIHHALRGANEGLAQGNQFHVRLAPHLAANLPEPIQAALARPREPLMLVPERSGLLGYLPGAAKSLGHPNEFYPGALRMDFPFRNLRLFRLFAGFPIDMLLKGGDDRPVVRAMLAGRLPDSIRLRRHGMPAEPDHNQRLQRQAIAAHARVAAFRRAEVGDWLDLDWLDAALRRIAAQGVASIEEGNEVQLTAITAEFLNWWRTRT